MFRRVRTKTLDLENTGLDDDVSFYNNCNTPLVLLRFCTGGGINNPTVFLFSSTLHSCIDVTALQFPVSHLTQYCTQPRIRGRKIIIKEFFSQFSYENNMESDHQPSLNIFFMKSYLNQSFHRCI